MLLNGVSTFVQCFTTSYQGSSQMTWLYKYVLSVYCFVCNALLIYLSAVVSRLLVCMHSWDTGRSHIKMCFEWEFRVHKARTTNEQNNVFISMEQFLKSIFWASKLTFCPCLPAHNAVQKHIPWFYMKAVYKGMLCNIIYKLNVSHIIYLCCTVIFCYSNDL